LFGNNVVLGRHVVQQLERLGAVAPPGFTGRRVDDLGCGDGRVTVLLGEILQPLSLRGFDINPALVRRARSRGIEARIVDLEHSVPVGELAVLWGVLHHLSDPARCLVRVRANYDCAFIREPIRRVRPACFELGKPMRRGELSDLLRTSLPGCELFDYEDCVLAFWESRKRAGAQHPAVAWASVVSAARR
jgi:SAM-dependent methyltransferase